MPRQANLRALAKMLSIEPQQLQYGDDGKRGREPRGEWRLVAWYLWLASAWPLVLLSGLLFGAVFLSLVASTTALVRHNLPPAQWASGIAAFTVVFAAGQIVGPTMVGWVSDGPGGLARGFVLSALALWVGAGLALRQRPLRQLTRA